MLPGMPGAAPGVFTGSLFTPSGAEAGVVTGVEGTLCEAPAEDGLRLRSAIITRFESWCGCAPVLSVVLSAPMLSVVLSASLSVVLSDPVPSAVLSDPACRTSLPSCVTSSGTGRGRAGAGQVVALPMLLGLSP
eukprot:jgi/Chrpa1/17686/Chrysochromulina_OHIO_Genome00021273-RA